MTREEWQHLCDRIKALEFGCRADVETVLDKILAMPPDQQENPDLERAASSFIGHELCRALDTSDHTPDHEAALMAIEVELIGRTLNHSLQRGWLVKSPSCPDRLPALDDFL